MSIYDDEECLFHIYAIKNDLTEEVIYIGCTTQPLWRRLYQHTKDEGSAIYNVIHDVGEEHFSIILLRDYIGYMEEAHFLESEYTKAYAKNNRLFNKRIGDEHTEYTKAKLRKPKKKKAVDVLLRCYNDSPPDAETLKRFMDGVPSGLKLKEDL